MYYFRLLNCIWSRFVEWIRGKRVVIEITEVRSPTISLIAYAVHDYTVTIHCKERKYLIQYQSWYIPNKVQMSYEVFSTVAGAAPKALIEACASDKTFGPLLELGASSRHQKEAAIEAYIDLIAAHLEALKEPIYFK